ncbi:MAG TPA: hypothetical protein VF581_11810 [Flavobacterium sp.]
MFKFINKFRNNGNFDLQVDNENSWTASSTATDSNSKHNDSLMHLLYQRKVNAGLIPNNQTCGSCICFGDEWPL